MKKYVKEFFLRGMMFGGFGPVIMGIIYAIVQYTTEDFSVTGYEICFAIFSTYILAFVHAGVSVFNQIEHWPVTKSLFCHLGSLYVVYVLCYLVNSWIPFEPMVLLIFTIIFIVCYMVIWCIVVAIVKTVEKKLNAKLVK